MQNLNYGGTVGQYGGGGNMYDDGYGDMSYEDDGIFGIENEDNDIDDFNFDPYKPQPSKKLIDPIKKKDQYNPGGTENSQSKNK